MNIAERDKLISSIVARVADYRVGAVPTIDEDRVLTWCGQFDEPDRPTILKETERILRASYMPLARIRTLIQMMVTDPSFVGANPEKFWRSVGYLRLQTHGGSQLALLALFEEILTAKFGTLSTASAESSNSTYIYLDDALYSGLTVKHDIQNWVEANDIRDATVHIICIAAYTSGEWHAKSNLLKLLNSRRVNAQIHPRYRLESRKSYARDAASLWLASVPEGDPHVENWKDSLTREDWFTPRPVGGRESNRLFSSEESRHTIEQAFFKKGAYIYSLSDDPDDNMRPLGYSKLETPGFGATLITYRNCPNNAPLVLWWGNPQEKGPLSKWTPLLPRHFGAAAHE